MKGIGRRVAVGFLSIVVLLSISGIISLFELSNLSNDTEVILSASRRNLEMAKDMVKSAHEHSQAALHFAVFNDMSQRDVCRRTMGDLEGILAAARSEAVDVNRLDSLALRISTLRQVSQDYIYAAPKHMVDTLVVAPMHSDVFGYKAIQSGRKWYDESYKPAYDNLVDEIQNFMTHTHSSLAPRAEQLNKNAYRSVAPVFISLVVMIAIVLMFYYFIRVYCVKPIESINHSLSDFLSYRLPFNVKEELLDELKELSDNIEKLIALFKQNKQ